MRTSSNGRVRMDRGDGSHFWVNPGDVDKFTAANPGATKVQEVAGTSEVGDDDEELATRSRSRK